MDDAIKQDFAEDGVTFEHPRDGFSEKLTYAEIRERGTVVCGVCGTSLGSFEFLVQSMEDGIKKASENPDHMLRDAAVHELAAQRDRLLNA